MAALLNGQFGLSSAHSCWTQAAIAEWRKINVVLENFNEDEQLKEMGRYHYFNGNPGEDKIYYTRKLALNQKMRLKAENLMSDEAKITVNKA